MKGWVIVLGVALFAYGGIMTVTGNGQPVDVAVLLSGIVAVGWGIIRQS